MILVRRGPTVGRGRASGVSLYSFWIPLGSVLLLLAAWEIVGRNANPSLIAPFSGVLVAWAQLMVEGTLPGALAVTVEVLALGFALSVAVGVPLGLLMGRYRTVDLMTDVYVTMLLAAPIVTFIPIFILIFGFGTSGRVGIVALFALPTIVVNAKVGIETIPPRLVEMARAMGSTERQIFRKVLLPGAVPAIFAGLRLGMSRAVLGVLLSEMVFNAVGLGGVLLQFRGSWMVPQVYATILTVVLLALAALQVLAIVQKRMLKWRPATQK